MKICQCCRTEYEENTEVCVFDGEASWYNVVEYKTELDDEYKTELDDEYKTELDDELKIETKRRKNK